MAAKARRKSTSKSRATKSKTKIQQQLRPPNRKRVKPGAKKKSPPIKEALSAAAGITFDSAVKRRWLHESVNRDLHGLELTELELVERGLTIARQLLSPTMTIEQFLREGAHRLAKTLVATAMTPKRDVARNGVAGSVDERLAQAVSDLRAEGKPITPSRVARRARPQTNPDSAMKYLIRQGLWTPAEGANLPPAASTKETPGDSAR